ncbi:MAG: TolC family protein [Planctomycetaceae bacterium]
MNIPRFWTLILSVLTATAVAGCLKMDRTLHYLGDSDVYYYKQVAQQIDEPYVNEAQNPDATQTEEPRTVRNRRKDKVRDMTLMEAIHTALANNRVIRTNGQFLSAGNSLYNNPNGTPSIYDPSIQESGVLFGGRGVEAALAEFDTQLTTSILWGRDEQVQNNAFFGGGLAPGSTLSSDSGIFRSALSKRFADGGSFLIGHDWNYSGRNLPSQLFSSVYTGNLRAEYRRPLWAGSGTEYTRIAGPSNPNFGAITGVSQGVVIARINNDITLGNFQMAVRNLVKDVEDAYWDLYLAYQLYDSAVIARNSALRTWNEAKSKLDIGGVRGFDRASEPQARAQYYEARATAEARLGGQTGTGQGGIYYWEGRLRRLLGLPVNDGTIIRPSDEPAIAELAPNWEVDLAEALTRRAELRNQKWNIKSLELQLQAAKSLINPNLSFVSSYSVNGFGDQLFGQNDNDRAGTAQGLRSAYESLSQGNQTGWTLGLEFSMPLGFRSAQAQVRNYELRLAKAREVLAAQELEISHELANAYRNLAVNYANMKSNFERRRAEHERVSIYETREGTLATTDIVLRAQRDRALADSAYFQAVIAYNKAIADLNYRKGTLLEYNNILLAEDEWNPEAYQNALRRARARSHALDNQFLKTEPLEFVIPRSQPFSEDNHEEPRSVPPAPAPE